MCPPVVFTLPVRSALLSTRAEIIVDVGICCVSIGRSGKSVVGCHCICEGDLRWYLTVVESRSGPVNREFCLWGDLDRGYTELFLLVAVVGKKVRAGRMIEQV